MLRFFRSGDRREGEGRYYFDRFKGYNKNGYIEWVSSFGQDDFNQKKDFISEQSQTLFNSLNENANELAHVKSQLAAVEAELKELDKYVNKLLFFFCAFIMSAGPNKSLNSLYGKRISFLQNSKTLSKKLGMANASEKGK